MLYLIETRQWDELNDLILSDPDMFTLISEVCPSCEESHGMSILHVTVRYDPPTSLLKRMLSLYPDALAIADCLGRTPLHVAAGSDVSPSVTKLLVVNYPGACNIQDEAMQTPLHIACDTSCELYEDDEGIQRCPPNFYTVGILLSGSLDALLMEDINEMNAIECAIASNADFKVVRSLQKSTQKAMQQKRGR